MIYDIEHLFMCILFIRCVVWFHCCFNLQFAGDLWYWASLHVHIVICICSYGGVCSDTLAILFLSYVFLLLSFKSSLYILDVKWSESHSVLTLCNPMECIDCIVHEILQARILEWVAVPFSGRSPQPRDQTQVSYIAGGFFTNWATREVQEYWSG